ncbi:retrovirus-related pol polyprotein from transposon TNT 1-94 [Tanacetum coccineum]
MSSVLSIIAAENLHLEQLDVKTAFLHGDIDEYIYMTQLENFQSAGKEQNLVCKLKKSLYRLKQAPRQWYLKFESFMQRAVYKRCAMKHCSDVAEIKKVKRQLSQEFKMKDLDTRWNLYDDDMYEGQDLSHELQAICDNMDIRMTAFGHFKLSKKQAPKTEASRRRMAKVLYASAVGSVIRKEVVLEGFFDSDYEGCLDSGKSTTGYVFIVGGTAVNYMSRIQKCVAMSTTEAEYMAIAEAGKELNPVFHGRTKHIKIRYHYIRELVSKGTLSLKKILRAKNSVDMLTKVVTTKKLKLCVASTGLRDK